MSRIKAEYKKVLLEVVKGVAINLTLTVAVAALILWMLHCLMSIELQLSGTALSVGIIGATLAFAGNNLVADSLGRWGSHDLPQWKWGNRLQSVGFALTLVALLIK